MRLLASHNQYPDNVSINIEAIQIDEHQYDLYLTLELNQQWQSLLNGRIQWGLRGGTLYFCPKNCLVTAFSSVAEGFEITLHDSPTTPTWVFFNPSLVSSLKQVKLGTLTTTSNSYHLLTTFTASGSDICITNTEGLWKHDISPNKHGVLERKLALFLLDSQLSPHISYVAIGTEDAQVRSLYDIPEIASERLSELQSIIACIYEASTNNLLELAKLAHLNPLTDFMGGNFLAGDWSKIVLNGANLFQASFRGANLTDADLSEANLSYAKLNGADLSGAYLGNANLSHADLYRASLALANLIGANLQGANLQETNISQTNFSRAIVTDAIFGNNLGMTDALKISLKERGATFNKS